MMTPTTGTREAIWPLGAAWRIRPSPEPGTKELCVARKGPRRGRTNCFFLFFQSSLQQHRRRRRSRSCSVLFSHLCSHSQSTLPNTNRHRQVRRSRAARQCSRSRPCNREPGRRLRPGECGRRRRRRSPPPATETAAAAAPTQAVMHLRLRPRLRPRLLRLPPGPRSTPD